MTEEQAVRDAAVKLHDAIKAADAVGLRVTWPGTAEGLPAIAVSETRRTQTITRLVVEEKPVAASAPVAQPATAPAPTEAAPAQTFGSPVRAAKPARE